MADTSILHITVDINTKEGRNALRVLRGETVKFTKDSTDGASAMGLAWTELWSKVQLGVSAFNVVKGALSQLVGPMIQNAATLETYTVQFEVLLGSAEAAKDLMAELRHAGAVTPYEYKDLAGGVAIMKQYGIATEDVMDNIMMLSDVAMGDANKLNSLSLAFSKVSATGKMTSIEFNSMINAGFNPLRVISEQTGRSIEDLQDAMSRGAISSDMLKNAFKAATSEGGQFYQMNEKMSKTFVGLVNEMKDSLSTLAANLGAPILEGLKGGVGILIDTLEKPEVQAVFNKIAESVGMLIEVLGEAFEFLVPVLEGVIETIGAIIPPVLELVKVLLNALKPILDIILKTFNDLRPTLIKLVTAVQGVVKALSPLIEMLGVIIEHNLETMIPLLESMIDLLIAVTPLITGLSYAIGVGMRFYSLVIDPMYKAIRYIVEYGAKAVGFVTSIFGGAEEPKKKETTTTATEPAQTKTTTTAVVPSTPKTTVSRGTGQKKGVDKKAMELWFLANERGLLIDRYRAEMFDEMNKDWMEKAERDKALVEEMIKSLPSPRPQKHTADDELAEMREYDRIRMLKAQGIADELLREVELYNIKMDMLASEFMAEEEYIIRRDQLERDSAERIKQIQRDRLDSYMSHTSEALTNIGTLAEDSFVAQKSLAIAQGMINAYQSYTKTTAELGFMAIPLALLVLATSLKQVEAMKQISPGRRSGGAAMGGGMYYMNEGGRQEYIINADATARNRALLSAINAGATIGDMTGGRQYGVPITSREPIVIEIGGEFRFEDGAVRAQVERDLTVLQGGTL